MENESKSTKPDKTQSDGKPALDPKTALVIEQTEKSLRQMENSLGHDHPVVAQMLDTNAKILRQANIRHLDALNMEARAKAIRAKHNIPEPGPKASETLEFAAPIKPIASAGQLKTVIGALVFVACIGLIYIAAQTLKHAGSTKKPLKSAQTAESTEQSVAPPEVVELPPVGRPEAQTPTPVPDHSAEAAEAARADLSVKERMLELANAGQFAENAGDLEGAREAYINSINAGKQASQDAGRTIVCVATAQSFEGLARICESKGESEKASEHTKNAALIHDMLAREPQ